MTFSVLVHPVQWVLEIFEAFDASLIDLDGEDVSDLERLDAFACQRGTVRSS